MTKLELSSKNSNFWKFASATKCQYLDFSNEISGALNESDLLDTVKWNVTTFGRSALVKQFCSKWTVHDVTKSSMGRGQFIYLFLTKKLNV